MMMTKRMKMMNKVKRCADHECLELNEDTNMLDYACPNLNRSLECMFRRQIKLQEKTGNGIMPRLDPELVAAFSLGLISELGEVLQVYKAWKPWKQEDAPFDKQALDDEIADMWHFMINMSLSLGYAATDIVEIFNKKHREVEARDEHNKEITTI
jgi:hypothetical protein